MSSRLSPAPDTADPATTGVHLRHPVALGVLCGVLLSLGVTAFGAGSPGEGHAVLVAAAATPYIVFALLDGSRRSGSLETAAIVGFVAIGLVGLDAPVWLVAASLVGHAG